MSSYSFSPFILKDFITDFDDESEFLWGDDYLLEITFLCFLTLDLEEIVGWCDYSFSEWGFADCFFVVDYLGELFLIAGWLGLLDEFGFVLSPCFESSEVAHPVLITLTDGLFGCFGVVKVGV